MSRVSVLILTAVCCLSTARSSSVELRVLAAHNKVREEAGGSDMQKMIWDSAAAASAQNWANRCVFKHSSGDSADRGKSSTGKSCGENLAAGQGSWEDAIQSWADERKKFQYGAPDNQCFPSAGHYTQMVWASSYQVGCASASCKNLFPGSADISTFYVCRYCPAGNMQGSICKPYKKS